MKNPAMAALPLSLALAGVIVAESSAINLINNGSFESGFAGWTRMDQIGSEGTFWLQTGTTSPVTGTTVPAPPDGTTAAMTDAEGPGAHLLYQAFALPSPAFSATLGFDLYIGNRADAFYAPDTLDFATAQLNQQARVEILRTGADPFSVDAGDILLNAFLTMPGSDLVSGYNRVELDVTGLLNANIGNALTLRFAETDNVFMFQVGIDNVSLTTAAEATVPDGGPGFAAAAAVAAMFWLRLRRGAVPVKD